MLFFVVLCLANQTGIDLQAAFDKKMDFKSVEIKIVTKTMKS
jgi:NTP pyrophosphatase (non-canonical NTP hydrolase)